MRLSVPAYFRAGDGWQQLVQAQRSVGIAVLNPASGAGRQVVRDYLPVLTAAATQGIRVLGYIDTSNGSRPQADVMADAERYVEWYGTTGFFLDQADVPSDVLQSYFTPLCSAIRSRFANATIVVNPGTDVSECFAEVADVIVDFEGPCDRYLRTDFPAWRDAYDPCRFWHIVYSVTDASFAAVVETAAEKNAGWIYLTDQSLAGDAAGSYLYDRLPTDSMWKRLLGVAGPVHQRP